MDVEDNTTIISGNIRANKAIDELFKQVWKDNAVTL